MAVKRKQSVATSQARKRRRPDPSDQTNTTEEERSASNDSTDQQDSQSNAPVPPTVRVQSNVWKYAHRDRDTPGWAICKLCPTFPNPKRISVKEGTTSALRKHLVNVHNKTELKSVPKTTRRPISSLSPSERDRLHQLLIDAVVIDGRSFSDFRKPRFSRFLDEIFPGRVAAYELIALWKWHSL